MKTAHQFILVVIVSLLGAAVVLSFGREEHAAMLAGEGRHQEAIALLERRLVAAPPDPELLASIVAEQGNWRKARQVLELSEQKAPPDASAGRLLLLEVLIQGNEVDRVYERAQTWMMAWRSPFLSGKLILRVAQAGLTGPASRLALKYTDIMPDDTFEVVGMLARKGRWDVAHQMLVRWADRTTKPTGRQLHEFVQTSALVGDISGPLVKLVQLVHSGSGPVAPR